MHRSLLAALLVLGGAHTLSAGPVFEPLPLLPPECPDCGYHALGPMVFGPFVLSGLHFENFSGIVRTPVGLNDERETYGATGGAVLFDGSSFFDVFFSVSLETLTLGNRPIPTGTFDTEMLQMNLGGGNFPFLLRESPTLPSLGQSTVQPVPGGFQVDSFFDVFTELSIDGGQSWIPSNGPSRLEIDAPEPSAAALALLGLMAVGLRHLRSRRRSERHSHLL